MRSSSRQTTKYVPPSDMDPGKLTEKQRVAIMTGVREGKLSPDQAVAKARAPRLDPKHLEQLTEDDRIAMLNAVKHGELSPKEAVDQVHDEATQRMEAKAQGRRGRRARQGGLKKAFRGRLRLCARLENTGTRSPTLVLTVDCARDLEPLSPSPYVVCYVRDSASVAGGEQPHSTRVKPGSRHPLWGEQFAWAVTERQISTETWRLHIQVFDKVCLGALSFALAEVQDVDSITEGWFKLLDEHRGTLQNIAFTPRALAGQALAAAAGSAVGVGVAGVDAGHAQQVPEASLGAALPTAATPVSVPTTTAAATAATAADVTATTTGGAKVALQDFVITKMLGEGSFGKVLLATMKGHRELVAIKVLKKTAVLENDDVAGTMTEKRVLALAGELRGAHGGQEGSPFLTRLHATFQDQASLCFVMEFNNGGDLLYHIQEQGVFGAEQSRLYAMEILLGLWYLHAKGVIYRDLKLDNVMLDASGHVKIADFGMCKENIFGNGTTTTFCGTPGYLAPEIIRDQPYGASVDFWSLGVLCFEFLLGDSPFDPGDDGNGGGAVDNSELYRAICNDEPDYTVDDGPPLDPSAVDFLDGLLTRDPKKRLGCGPDGQQDIKRHAFFAGKSWGAVAARKVAPPFKPNVSGNFDPDFLGKAPEITPVNQGYLDAIEQSEFSGFSFVNAAGVCKDHVGAGASAPGGGGGEGAGGGAGDGESQSQADLQACPWYRPELDRSSVNALLRGKPSGSFCVRESATQPGCYALSVSVSARASKPWTGLITPTYDGKGKRRYRLFVKQKFDTIPMLVAYYHNKACVTIDRGSREVKLVGHV